MNKKENLKKPPENMKEIFEIIKTKKGLKTDREIWEAINISGGFFKEVKAGRKFPSPETALKIAAMAGLQPCAILCLLEMEKAASEEIRPLWRSILERETSHNG